MKKRTFQAAVLSVAMISPLITTGTDVQAATAKEIATGKILAEKLCAKCHAVTKTGDSPNAKAPPFHTFAKKWPIENLEEALAEGIVVGHNIMPEFEFESQDIDNLLSYIDSLSQATPK